ncbi:MAG TPA: carboxypeptidase-like regulatory domain-containing protein [Hymenobacter sp.]|uniref:carboxypeptidase-like regulatory domain-containing protein n=1 Tax=Hymenobacter sp. TaxID=1898978 RepID=UPI002D7E7C26|nr:carboxypeptidase-like regulatory domain-containing protein [Hymenobacter sp.]HET9503127.1 carboxypeptidase-like regulatory domain-containing protein [Hymenobacter sp.]
MSRKLLGFLPLLLALLAASVPGRPARCSPMRRLAAGHPAAPPDSGRYTTVRGTVRFAQSGRPLAGVLLIINSCSFGYFGAWDFRFTGDSTRTDAQGRYALRFKVEEDRSRGYAILFDPAMGRRGNGASRYVFHDAGSLASSQDRPDRRLLDSNEANTIDFRPDFAPSYSPPIDLHLPKVGH